MRKQWQDTVVSNYCDEHGMAVIFRGSILIFRESGDVLKITSAKFLTPPTEGHNHASVLKPCL